MGSNQAKTAPSPMLPPVSCALSSQENHEQHIKNGIPRRVGSMILSNWIQMKRREQAILERARRAVNEGQAPPEVLEKVEKQLAKESRKYHIKYHPRILVRKSKPARPRLKAPKLTNTAARRIQASFQRREKEQEEATQLTKKQTRSRNCVKTHEWKDSLYPDDPRGKQTSRERSRRSSTVPPTSTLSLQSITTAESSGIGMSRASSMTSVASSRHKTLYTRQRVRSLEEDEKLLEELRALQQRHQSKTPVPGECSNSNQRSLGEASGRHRCKTAERHAQQHFELEQQAEQQIRRVSRRRKVDEQSREQQQRNKKQTSKHTHWEQPQRQDHDKKTSRHQQKEHQPTTQQEIQPKSYHKQIKKHLSQIGKTEKPPSQQKQNTQATPVTRKDGQQQPSSHQGDDNQERREKRRPRKEKKDQGSQTRMSGPPRPRHLLLAQQQKKRARNSQEQPRTRFRLSEENKTDNSSFDTQKNPTSSHDKQASRTGQSGTNKDQGRNSTSNRERSQELHTSQENSQQVSADTRRNSYIDLDDLNIQGQQHNRLPKTENERQNQQEASRNKREVQLIEHQVQVHHSNLRDEPQSRPQEFEPQLSHQQEQHPSDHSHPAQHDRNQHSEHRADLPEEQLASSQEYEQSIGKTKVTRQKAEILEPNQSESQSQAQAEKTRKSAHGGQLSDSERTVESQGGGRIVALSSRGRPGGSLEHIHTLESQSEGHSRRSHERDRTIKSQGGESLRRLSHREYTVESQSGKRSRSLERGHPSASTARLQIRSSSERARPGASLEGGRDLTGEKGQRHQPVAHASVEHVLRERSTEQAHHDPQLESTHGGHFVERIHHDPLLQSFRSVPSLHRMHHELPARYVHRAHVVEYTRHEPSLDRLHQDMRVGRAGSPVHRERTISYTERGRRLYPVSDRNTAGVRDLGYNSDTSEPGRIRLYGERRYNGGYMHPSHTGAYAEQSYATRSLEPSYPRLYSDRTHYRAIEPDHTRSYSGKSLEPYPENIPGESRWRSTGQWEDGERGMYKEMITPLNAPSQSLDHRAL